MLSDFLHTLVEFAAFLWPIKLVHQWERGIYLVAGRVRRPWAWVGFRRHAIPSDELPPGPYLALPWFTDVHAVPVSWDFVKSGRIDLTLKDGRVLSCEATAKMRVVDLRKAWVEFHDYENDRQAMLAAVVAEALREAEAERFDPDRRGRLLGSSLLRAVREAADPLGHEVESVQVTTFILGSKTLRLLTEKTSI